VRFHCAASNNILGDRSSHKLLQLGDEIYVKVKNADLVKKTTILIRRIEEPVK
jgi:ribonuclease R